jgi:undecaprenyl-diphosphatase
MDERRRMLAVLTVLIGVFVLVIVVIGMIISSRRVLSPVPEDNAIKIIFVTPTTTPLPSGPSEEGPATPTGVE